MKPEHRVIGLLAGVGLLLATLGCNAFVFPGGGSTTPPLPAPTGITQTPTPLSISAATGGSTTIATLAEQGGTGSGVTFSVTGNSNLTVTGNQLKTSSSPSFVAGVNQTYSLSVTDTGGTYNDPSPRTLIIPGGGSDVLLTTANIVEPSGNSQTGMFFTIGIPFGSTQMDASHRVKVVDNDTMAEIPCQEDNRSTDASTTAVRFESLTCYTDSATANENKSLTVYANSSIPVTGTDITIADINAYFAGGCNGNCTVGYDLPVVFQNLNGSGNDYTASLNTGLTSGNSGWINKTTPTVMGKYRSGGGLVTEYPVFVPATHSGTPDSQMYVEFDIACYKSQRGAVSGGNPILGCRIDEINKNAWAQAVSTTGNYFGLCVGTGCSVANLPNSAPAITLTASQATQGNNLSTTASGSFFTADRQGQLISNGTGLAVVDGYSGSPTLATLSIKKDFGSSTIGSGTYTLFGTTLPSGSKFKYRTWVGFAHQQPDTEKGQAHLGDAWNSGTLAGGPFDYYVSTGALMNYTFTAASYNSTNDYNTIVSMGTNPSGYGNSQNGLSPLYLETTGGRADLGVIPDYNAAPFKRFDDKAAFIIFGQASRWATMQVNYADQNTGLTLSPCNAGTLPTCSGSKIYVLDNRFTNDVIIAQEPSSQSIGYWIGDGFAHDPASFYGALLMSGDKFWMDGQQASSTYAWMQPNAGTPGSGFQKTLFVPMNVCCGLQGRGTAWAQNALFHMAYFTPDSNPVLGWSKAMVRQYLSNTFAGTQSFKTGFLDNTSAGLNFFTTNGPHFLADLISEPPWQASFAFMTLASARERGVLDTDGMAEFNWFASNPVQVAIDPTINGAQMSTGYYGLNHMGNTATCPSPYVDSWTYVNTWQDFYQANALVHPDAAVLFEQRKTTTNLTLSATSGTAVTATLSGGNYFNTTAFYPHGWISTPDGGRGQIVSVTNANTVVIDTTVTKAYANSQSGCALYSGHAFGSTSYSAGGFYIPNAAPGDDIGTQFVSNANGFDFTDLMQVSAGFTKQWSMPNGATAYTNMINFWGGKKNFYPQKWNIDPRTVLPFLPLDADDAANDNFMPKRLMGWHK